MAKLIVPADKIESSAAAGVLMNQPPREPHTLTITISHGDLRQAKYPLAVGHYHGDTIVHAEKLLDYQLGGRLTELFNMFLYPGPEDTSEVIHVPGAKPPGALVIGLGDVGEIKPSAVRNGICNAVLRHALFSLNEARNKNPNAFSANGSGQAENKPLSVGFSTLLLGTYGGNALSVEASLSAIVQGALRANEALRTPEFRGRVLIDEIEIVELYEDVALEAARAATYMAKHPPSNLMEGDKLLVMPNYLHPLGNGRTQRPVDPYKGGWWRRIRVTSEKDKDGNEGLNFLALTDRARAEDTLQYTQKDFIEDLVQRAVSSSSDADELSTVLFKLLIPNSIKDQTRSEVDLLLILDSVTAQYPWELLAERTRDKIEPLATRMGLIRQFQTKNFTLNPQPAREPTALVIGEPQSDQIPLPGAVKEAEQVATALKSANYIIDKPLLHASGIEVLNQLFAKGYKILHLAGHGQYKAGKPGESGMILDNGRTLSTITLRNLSPLPELVFINCCHLGRLDENDPGRLGVNQPHALASSISEELINMGVKAVVAAGWAVEDKAAAAFARVFYEEMLRGQKFGSAVLAARKAAKDESPNSNTWGAYQCYGNPDFVLEHTGGPSNEKGEELFCYSLREYEERLEDIQSDSTRCDANALMELRQQLERLNENLPAIWRGDGKILRAFGGAWAALGNYKEAIDCYLRATEDERAAAPVNTIEQLANMRVRYADQLREESGNSAAACAEANRLIDEAIAGLKWVLKLGASSERFSLMASCYKGKANAAGNAQERRKFIRLSKDYYGKAHQFYKQKTGSINPYPAINWLAHRFLLGESIKSDFKVIDECIAYAKEAERKEPSFWNRVTEPDGELLRHLAKGDIDDHLGNIIALYKAAFGSGVTTRQRSSVVKQFDFLIEMLESMGGGSASTQKNVNALKSLRTAVNSRA